MVRLPQRVRELLGDQKVLVNHRLTGIRKEQQQQEGSGIGTVYVSTFEVTHRSETGEVTKETKVMVV